VAAHASEDIAAPVRAAFRFTDDDLATSHPAHPAALKWALSLWTERLVGGPATRPDDPPVIVAITRLDRAKLFRLVAAFGLAKLACALGSSADAAARDDLNARDRARLDHFAKVLAPFEPSIVHQARLDLARARSGGARIIERLGMTTIGRLLASAEPHRVRWALQHLPYNLAKFTRARINLANRQVSGSRLFDWESRLFEAARDRLRDEGHLPDFGGKGNQS